MAYIIVKYADEFPDGWTREDAYYGYSCSLAGIAQGKVYQKKDTEAELDLFRLNQVNPSVGYGFVEVE